MAYRADIDGLRGIAVLCVLVFHAFPDRLRGGFMGVDMFFALSGFLITGLLLAELDAQRFSLAGFYRRRIRRIFPALLAVLVASLAAGWTLLLPDEFEQLGQNAAAGAAFVSNRVLAGERGYFDFLSESQPLLHLWSLAIEEQFYILWPLLLWAVWQRRWNVFGVMLAAVIVSWAVHFRLTTAEATAAFYAASARAWELMAGGLLAWVSLRHGALLDRHRHARSLLGAALLCGVFFVGKGTPWPTACLLMPVLGTLLLISAGPQGCVNRWVLSRRVLVGIGLISFPLYLWHWPLLAFARIVETGYLGSHAKLALMASAFGLAALTYRWVERPIRAAAPTPGRSLALAAAMAAVAALGLAIAWQQVPPRAHDSALQAFARATVDWEFPQGLEERRHRDTRVFHIEGGRPTRTVFWGDSHMDQYAPRITERVRRGGDPVRSADFLTWGSCPPIPGIEFPGSANCARAIRDTLDFIDNPQVDTVVIAACWNCYFSRRPLLLRSVPGNAGYRVRDAQGRWVGLASPEGQAAALAELQALMTRLAKTKRVYLVLDNPLSADQDPGRFASTWRLDRSAPVTLPETVPASAEQQALAEAMRAVAERSGAIVLDPNAVLCSGATCRRMTGPLSPIYKDSNHLRPFFVKAELGLIDETVDRR